MSYRTDAYGRPVFECDRSYWYGENMRPQSDLARRVDEMAKELQFVEQQKEIADLLVIENLLRAWEQEFMYEDPNWTTDQIAENSIVWSTRDR